MKIQFKEFIKKRKKLTIISAIVLVVVILIGWRIVESKNSSAGFEYYTVNKGNVIQEVTATGKVKPAVQIDYSFETSGRVNTINVNVGDQVKSGQVLAVLKNNDLSASVAQASAGVESAQAMVNQYQAQLDAQQAKLQELKNGARPEDIQVSLVQVANAEKALDDAKTNLTNVQNKANSDLSQLYVDCANSSVSAVNAALNSLNVLTDIQYSHFNGNDQDASMIADAKDQAVSSLVGGVDGGRWMFLYINQSAGGAKQSALTAQVNPTEANILKALNDVDLALLKTKNALDTIPMDNRLTTLDNTNLSAEKNSMNAQISLISGKINAISNQKNVNQNLITAANSAINQAQNNLDLANQQLAFKKSGSSIEDISAQEAVVRQAQASLNNAFSQVKSAQASLAFASATYSKSIINSSIDGIVTAINIKAGEMAALNQPAISVMSNAKFSIEAYIPEADIAKIKVGNDTSITLDAYGSDVLFNARVVKIDPAETIIDGVSTYKTTLEFLNEDERVKSGMTANLTISTAKSEGVLTIPQRDLIKNNAKNFVLISHDGKTTQELEVQIGLTGSDGNVEVVSGLVEGGKIVNPSSVKK